MIFSKNIACVKLVHNLEKFFPITFQKIVNFICLGNVDTFRGVQTRKCGNFYIVIVIKTREGLLSVGGASFKGPGLILKAVTSFSSIGRRALIRGMLLITREELGTLKCF